MFKNQIIISLRRLSRNSGISFIHISGLAIGIAACLLIITYVQGEIGYDTHHMNSERIYRILRESILQSRSYSSVTSGALAAAVIAETPEVESVIRVRYERDTPIEYGDKSFDRIGCLSDSHFFEFFNFPLLQGEPQSVLKTPFSIVLSSELANNLFGNDQPIGKVVTVKNVHIGSDFTVTGIFDSPKHPTTINFDYIVSSGPEKGLNWLHWNHWRPTGWRSVETYVRLRTEIDPNKLENKLSDLIERHMGVEIRKSNAYRLQPLQDIYLRSNIDYGLTSTAIQKLGNIRIIYLFLGIAFLILLTACINYVNLTTAQGVNRAKEVGIRKTVGAPRIQLIYQFITETLIMIVLALLIALGLVEALLPVINSFVDKPLYFQANIQLIALLCGLVIFIVLLAGVYPAFVISRYQPALTFQKRFLEKKGSLIRNFLVICQFSVASILFIGTFVVHTQISFMLNRNPGFNSELLITMPIFEVDRRVRKDGVPLAERFQLIKESFLKNPRVLGATATRYTMGKSSDTSIEREVKPENDREGEYRIDLQMVDEDFMKVYGIDLIEGRNFSGPADSVNKIIINESAVKHFGWTNPIGKQFLWINDRKVCEVIGVMRDFNRTSLQKPITPMGIYQQTFLLNILTVRIHPEDIEGTIHFLEEKWKQFVPNRPFIYSFADENLEELYQSEKRLEGMIGFFTGLSVIIACSGLIGLASFAAKQRTKEIGIRKVLGASTTSIIFLLSRKFSIPVILANCISWPIAFMGMDNWLQNFAYRIDIGILPFIICGLVIFAIALSAVAFQTAKAAHANPVDSLKYE